MTLLADEMTHDPGLRRPDRPTWLVLPVAAVLWWSVGFLPWLVAGASGRSGADLLDGLAVAGRTPLPLDTPHLTVLVVGGVVGGIVAGLCGWLVPRRGLALLATSGGVLVGVVATLSVSRRLVVETAPPGAFVADARVVTGLSAVVVGAALAGWVIGAVGTSGRLGLALALSLLAGLSPSWVAGLAAALGHDQLPWRATTWGTAALVAVAFVVAGSQPWYRLLWWPVCAAAAYAVAPPVTGLVNLPEHPRAGEAVTDLVQQFWDVTKAAADPALRPWLPWVVAVGVAVATTLLLELTRRRPTDS
ncbi:hypothetical protein [Angustibacter luteus]|uniref:ABC transporter permease n=1 Tax=Angustibacter luteus TaxID=658456 RepID=A0ABW1JDQ5_9ACTN